jgi:hypothetical protein
MMATHLLKDECVTFIETHSWSDLGNELNTNIGMVAWPAFADVVQQGADDQKVWAINAINQRRGICRRFTEVTVNCEAVVSVALRAAPDDRPFGKNRFPESALIKRLDHLNRWATGEEEFNEQSTSFLGPWSR